MLVKRVTYLSLFVFLTWLAIATRTHASWFHPVVQTYGGDTIWAGMFLFFLRVFFVRYSLIRLSIICFALGVADELLQLYHAPWIESIRHTRMGGLMLGFGFLWSDIACYALGIVLAFGIIWLLETYWFKRNQFSAKHR